MKRKVISWILAISLLAIALISVMVILSEDNPSEPRPIISLLYMKLGAIAAIAAAVKAAKILDAYGYMPTIKWLKDFIEE